MQCFNNVKLDTDDGEFLKNFHHWRKRLEIILVRTPLLFNDPLRDSEPLSSMETHVYEHYDALLFGVLTNTVTGQQLESTVFTCNGGAEAYAK